MEIDLYQHFIDNTMTTETILAEKSPADDVSVNEGLWESRHRNTSHMSLSHRSQTMASSRGGLTDSLGLLMMSSSRDSSTIHADDACQWTLLKPLSAKLSQLESGHATVISVSKIVVVGTSMGATIVFDFHQRMIANFWEDSFATMYGAVTCVSASGDGMRVASGHASGSICVWDMTRFTLIVHIQPSSPPIVKRTRNSNCHTRGVSISRVVFCTHNINHFVTGDAHGNLCYHILRSGLLSYTTDSYALTGQSVDPTVVPVPSCIFSLTCAMVPRSRQQNHLIYSMGFVAYVTSQLVTVISTYPKIRREYTHVNQGPAAMTGCSAWVFQAAKQYLAYSWNDSVTVLCATFDSRHHPNLKFQQTQSFTHHSNVVALEFLTPEVITYFFDVVVNHFSFLPFSEKMPL